MRPCSNILTQPHRVGIVGTGFIASGLWKLLNQKMPDLPPSAILTRRDPAGVEAPAGALVTQHLDEFLEHCDVVVECSGDVIHTTNVVEGAFAAGKPVVTMKSEFHITTGSYFVGKGRITEARGDQAGSLAWLHDEAVEMGFTPKVYGNIKGFLNLNPSLEDMKFWSARNGISLSQVTAFTDGTKVHIEQAHVANGLHAQVSSEGLLGPKTSTLQEAAIILAHAADEEGIALADYVLTPEHPGAVFIVASHDEAQRSSLSYMKLGNGPDYLLIRPYHLCHLEIASTLRRFLGSTQTSLLDNSRHPVASVAAVAKRNLVPGDRIDYGTGSFELRGEAVRMHDYQGHLPMGLVKNAIVRKLVKAGNMLSLDDVELPDSLAYRAWKEVETLALERPAHTLSSRSATGGAAGRVA
jgi:predicted homoserine dehydrogenase-like protein